jgi:hypothetical protein
VNSISKLNLTVAKTLKPGFYFSFYGIPIKCTEKKHSRHTIVYHYG